MRTGNQRRSLQLVLAVALATVLASVPKPQAAWGQDEEFPLDVPANGEFVDGEVVDEWVPELDVAGVPGQYGPPAPIFYTSDWFNEATWYTKQDIVILNRGKPRVEGLSGRAIFFDGANFIDNSGQMRQFTFQDGLGGIRIFDSYLTTQSARLRTAPGARITLGRRLGRDDQNRDREIEFTFFGLFAWEAANQLTSKPGTGPEVFFLHDLLLPGFSLTEFHQVFYSADLNSFELNYRIKQRPGRDRMLFNPDGTWVRESTTNLIPTYIGGVRFLQTNENFQYISRGINPNTRSGDYYVDTQNDLIGLQAGVELIHHHQWWNVGVWAKTGGFVNFAEQESRVRIVDAGSNNVPPDRDEKATSEPLAFLTEFEIFARIQLRSNMALRVAFDLQYVQGLAIAPEQITFNVADPPRINNSGFMVNTGLAAGFEMYW